MKKAYIKKVIAFCLSFLVLLSLSLFFAGAEEEEYIPVEWIMDPNAEYIYGGEKRYDRYYVNDAFYGDAKSSFYFENKAEFDGLQCQVYGESSDPHIVSVMKGDGYSFIFTDEKGRKILDDFLARTDCIYYLEDFGSEYTVIDASLVKDLDYNYKTAEIGRVLNISVGALSEAEIFEVTVHDKTETKAYQHGAVYVMPDGKCYYLCFEELDNSYFDADGYFSYRSGYVDVWVIDGQVLSDVKEALSNMQPKERDVIYESWVISDIYDIYGEPIEEEPYDSVGAIILFWVFFTLIGFIVPIVALIFGLLLPRSEKFGRNKYWYLIAALAAAWILAAVGIMLIIIV